LESDFRNVNESQTKIGSVIHYRFKDKEKAKEDVKKQIYIQLKANGKTDAEIKVELAKPEMQKIINHIATNERHYSIVILKDRSGSHVKNIIQKSGQLPMENKILPANINESNNYIPMPTSSNVQFPYFNK
tara:strand:+ start:657 stop:1049 length:393 start_codon:yes stop_codon:yes gene_type:complete